ncbi:MAG: ubiquinol-cytochrome c reductase iron-sulfur subunit [Gemmataceae bacterium]|nr:ubiquinol-cytochrome c reductase iron-sulfur subunit [Gemmataceae bacterium]
MSDPTPNTSITPATGGTPAGAATAPAAPAKPALPPKPTPPAKKGPTRRGFFMSMFGSWFAIAWVTMTASLVGMILGTVRFLFPNVLSEPPSTFKAGPPDQYEEGKVDDRFKPVGAWVIRSRNDQNQDTLYALSTTCTHLGCTPNWLEAEKKFKCPCHGSGFHISGINFEGPAPRPLERYAVRLGDDGQIVVDKSRKFQRELGQWSDPESYIVLG